MLLHWDKFCSSFGVLPMAASLNPAIRITRKYRLVTNGSAYYTEVKFLMGRIELMGINSKAPLCGPLGY